MRERGAAAHSLESSMATGEPARQEEKTRPERGAPVRPIELERGREVLPARPFEIGATSWRKQQKLPDGRWVDEPGLNQDTPVIDEELRVVGVADGMGGHEAGEKASAAVREVFIRELRRKLDEPFLLTTVQMDKHGLHENERELGKLREFVAEDLKVDPTRFASEQEVRDAIRAALEAANKAVAEAAPKGGTTFSCLTVHETLEGKLQGMIVHRGDSRIYVFRKSGLEQLTRDHSLVAILKDKGLIDDPEAVETLLSKEALRFLGGRYQEGTRIKDIRNVVTAALSAEDDVTHTPVQTIELRPEDLLVAVTDGPADNPTHADLTRIMRDNYTRWLGQIAEEIVRASRAVAHSEDPRAHEDDMTAVVARIGKATSLKEVLQQNLIALKERIQDFDDDKLGDETVRLVSLRNQAEIALAAHPDNDKLKALQAHLTQCLKFISARQAAVRQQEARSDTGATVAKSKRVKKETPLRRADAAH